MTEGNPGSTGWAAFEARMRDRRFARCIERANVGLEAGTLEEVRDALDEARILCPGAPEIVELEGRIAALPSPSAVIFSYDAPVQEPPAGWIRVAGAMCILVLLFGLFGFGLAQLYIAEPARLFSLDLSKRDTTPELLEPPSANAPAESPAPTAAPPVPQTPSPAPTPATETPVAPSAPTTPSASPNAAVTSSTTAPPLTTTRPAVATPPASSPVGTSSRPSRTTSVPTPSVPTPSVPTPAARPETRTPPPAPTTMTARREVESPVAAPPPPAPTRPETRPIAEAPPAASEPPVVNAASRPVPVTDPVLPLGSPVLSTGAAPPRVVPASMSREDESAQIRSLLSRYETAYNRLDSAAATSVWPGVDRAALDRAFKNLVSQRVSLGLCDITVVGDIGGASCAGKARWEPRIGGGLQTADRYWTFNLRKGNEGWRIEQIRVR